MIELMNGKMAKLVWANGGDIQVDIGDGVFEDVTSDCLLSVFDYPGNKFRKNPAPSQSTGLNYQSR